MRSSIYEFKKDDAIRFANQMGTKIKPRGSELQLLDCPYCHGAVKGDKYTFSINLETGMFKCLRASCGIKGNMITLAKDFDFSLGTEVDEYFRGLKQFKRIAQVKIETKDGAVEYLKGRGIPEEITRKYEITLRPDNQNVLIFPFKDEKGIIRFIKYRNMTFKKGDNGSKEWCESDCKPILFGMAQCNLENKTLIMTEGQIDSLSVAAVGIENAVSVPTGKNGFTWVPYCWDFLGQFNELIVFGDHERDEITLLDEMTKRFRGTVKHVRPEDYKDCKDANEILQKYGKDQVKACINNAVPVPLNTITEIADVEEIDMSKIEKLPTGIRELDRQLKGGLSFGNVHIIGGKRGDGKSTFASQIIAHALKSNYSCLIYSGELLQSHVRSWLDSQIHGPKNVCENTDLFGDKYYFVSNTKRKIIGEWYRGRAFIYNGDCIETDEREDLLKTVENAIKQNGCRVILLDNLMTALDLTLDQESDKYEKQSHFVKQLARLAKSYKVCILLVAHRRKNNGKYESDANDEISGSGDITNLAGTVLSYDRYSKKEIEAAPEKEKSRRLIISKDRISGNINNKGINLNYCEKSKRIYGDIDDVEEDYGWDITKDDFIDDSDGNLNPFLEG